MHSSRCIAVTANVPTIALPRSDEQFTSPANSLASSLGVAMGGRHALIVSCSTVATLEFIIRGKRSLFVVVSAPGPNRVLIPEPVADVKVTAVGPVYAWLEPMDTYARPCFDD